MEGGGGAIEGTMGPHWRGAIEGAMGVNLRGGGAIVGVIGLHLRGGGYRGHHGSPFKGKVGL